MTQTNSRVADPFKRTYVNSNPDEVGSWGQPPASHYVLQVEGNHMSGRLISGVYRATTQLDLDDRGLTAIYAEFAEEDRALANAGLHEYSRLLSAEDNEK